MERKEQKSQKKVKMPFTRKEKDSLLVLNHIDNMIVLSYLMKTRGTQN